MKKFFLLFAALILLVMSIVPISTFAVKQAFSNKSKSWAPGVAVRGARVYMMTGRYRGAVFVLENMLNTWPRHEKTDRIHFWIGLCYEKSGNPLMAIQWYEAFVAKFPNHMWADQARRKLTHLRETAS